MDSNIKIFYERLFNSKNEINITAWYGTKSSPPNKSKWFKNAAELFYFINALSGDGLNVYHACAMFDKQKRQKVTAVGTTALWVDVDFKDFKLNTTKPNLKMYYERAIKQLDLLKGTLFDGYNSIVFTGGGIHIYWIFDEVLSVIEWAHLSNALDTTLKDVKFNYDTSRTKDIASLMRVPGTFNQKNGRATKIVLLNKNIVKKDFISNFNIPKKPTGKPDKKSMDALDALSELTHIKSDAILVSDGCPFIKHFKDTGFEGDEPAWRMALAIVRCCVDGDTIAHEWSSKDKTYDYALTQKKLIDLESRDIGAALCSTCEQFGFCNSCKFKGKLNSPLRLGTTVTEVNMSDVLEEETNAKDADILDRAQLLAKMHPTKEFGWIVGEEGIFKIVDGIPVLVSKVPFFIIDLINEDVDDITIVTAVIRSYRNLKPETFSLPLKYVEDTKKLLGEFNSRRIFPADKKLLKHYISQYMQNLWFVESQKALKSLGWQDDGSFFLSQSGDGILKDGCHTKSIVSRLMRGYIDGYTVKGSLEGWSKMVNKLSDNADLYPHYFSMMCSIGAPLLKFTSAKGFLLSLYGKSGTGKTLSHKVAMSVWGNPEKAGYLGRYDSNNAWMGTVAAVKNLPVRLDEMTSMKAAELAGVIFQFVNGRGRARATVDGSKSKCATDWDTLTLVTTNSPLLERSVNTISEAERCRILEIEVDTKDNNVELFTDIGRDLDKNYGVAGIAITEYIQKNKDEVLKRLSDAENKLRKLVDEDKRFWVACGAVAFTAAKIAKKIRLLDFNVGAVYDWYISQMTLQKDVVKRSLIDARGYESREEFIQALWDSLNGSLEVFNEHMTPIEKPYGAILGRCLHKKDKIILYVAPKVVQKFVLDRDSNASFRSVLKKFHVKPAETKRLGERHARFYTFEILK